MASRKDKVHGEANNERTPRHAATEQTEQTNNPGSGSDVMDRVIQSLKEVAATVGVHCQTLEKHDDRIKKLEEEAAEHFRKNFEEHKKCIDAMDGRIQSLETRVEALEKKSTSATSTASPKPVVAPATPAPADSVAPVAPVAPTSGTLNFRVSVPYSIGVVFGDANITRG